MKKIMKKGFTLAEVLIVLMVIGALATMLLPALMKGVNEAQWKSAYKKAYNAISNLCAMEKVAGALPAAATPIGQQQMFSSMSKSLSVKDYLPFADASATGQIPDVAHYRPCAVYTDMSTQHNTTCEDDGGGEGIQFTAGNETFSPWIITEDNIAYAIKHGAGGEQAGCRPKATINAQTTLVAADNVSCVSILVDVNGLSNGPNKLEEQYEDAFNSQSAMRTLTGDRYYIFIGSDGATPGNKSELVSGRIAADLK